jgi:hypothetical protein
MKAQGQGYASFTSIAVALGQISNESSSSERAELTTACFTFRLYRSYRAGKISNRLLVRVFDAKKN